MGIGGALFLILVIFCGIGIISAMIANSPAQKNSKAVKQSSKIGQVSSDAGFNFVVNSFKCGEKQIGFDNGVLHYSTDAQGQFCRLNITVTNAGNNSNSIRPYNQYIFNDKGQRYDYDPAGTGRAAQYELGDPFSDDINPGNSITGDIVFDVPVNVTPITAELHGDKDSSGIRVNLQ